MSHTIIREIQASDTWALRQQVMWPDRPISYVMLEDDPVGTHYGLYQDKLLISVISVFVRNGEAQFRKFATLASEQGKGYGTRLLSYLFEQLYGQQVHRIWCNARADKAEFYRHFGMVPTDQTFTKGGIAYVIMEKVSD